MPVTVTATVVNVMRRRVLLSTAGYMRTTVILNARKHEEIQMTIAEKICARCGSRTTSTIVCTACGSPNP